MVQRVTVLDAEVPPTAVTGQSHHLPLPAAGTFTLIGEDLNEVEFVLLRLHPFSSPITGASCLGFQASVVAAGL
jgi:hypothetical protein